MIINLLKLTMMVILLSKKKNNMAKLLKDRRFIQRWFAKGPIFTFYSYYKKKFCAKRTDYR